jgi:TonB family protein
MRRTASGLILGAATTLAVGCLAFETHAGPGSDPRGIDLPVEGVVTNPDWIAKPTGDELGAVYPLVPMALNISGRAEINCKVTAEGGVSDCKVIGEFPLGEGFGGAALALTPYFKMKPRTIDGKPVGGAAVNIPIRFQMAPSPAEPPDPIPQIVAPTPAALELARRIVAVSGDQPAVPLQLAGWMHTMQRVAEMQPASGEEARAQRAALDAFQSALQQAQPQFQDARARALARSYTEAELGQIASFLETPVGRAWATRQQAVDVIEERDTAALINSAREAARARYCETGHCASAAASSTAAAPR